MKTSSSLALTAVLCCAQAKLEPLLDTISAEVRTGDAMARMRAVWSTDRFFTFPKFHETSRWVAAEMRKIGLEQVEIVKAPADGRTQFGFWTMPLAWDVGSARLEIEGEKGEPLADRSRWPASVCMWSGATPPEGLLAEVVEYAPGSDMRGKFVLTAQNAANLKFELAKAGAAGAINAFTENRELRDGRQWVNAWGDFGWAFTKKSTPMPCFSITPNQADALRKRLPVRVRARVDSRLYEDSYPYSTGVIPGATREEVLTLGHAFEMGAQDNATGVAAMLEAMALLERLVRSGKLAKPRRTIRMLAMGEMYGTHHYVTKYADRVRRTIGAFCVDTPAAPYEMPGTHYTFYLNPHSGAAYTDALVLDVAEAWFGRTGRKWEKAEFMPGTDSFLGEPSVGIPTTWVYSGTGVHTHHNSEDTPEKTDPRSMRDLVTVNATFLYYLANAGPAEAARLEQSIRARFKGVRAQVALNSLRRLDPARRTEPIATPVAAGREIPRRTRFGTIPLDDLAPDQREGFPSGAWVRHPSLALYWADGKRSVPEIVWLTEQEAGPVKFDYEGYFRFLARRGYIELVRQ